MTISPPLQAAASAPALSSRPGAAYTLYLNFNGFNFNGQWGNTGTTPGVVPAYTGSTANIQEIWARTAEQYSIFDINVTTVDPAIAAGQSATDALRQAYYDITPRMMQTVIGGSNAWFNPGAGGVSYVGVAPSSFTSGGYKTNWVFPVNLGSAKNIADATIHENGHALGLLHQGDNLANTGQSNEYSTNNGSSGNGSFAPNMGVAYSAQRSLWRRGTVNSGTTIQNDVQRIFQNAGMTMVDDGIGNSFATATGLPISGNLVHSAHPQAKGIITPVSATAPDPLGINNYTKNYYVFSLGASSTISLTASSGRDWITPGVLAPGGTLRPKLNIYGASDLVNAVGFGVEATDTLSTTFSGNLAAGTYYVEITSSGGFEPAFDASADYYDLGSYMLSGTGFSVAVPEPGTLALLVLGVLGAPGLRRRGRRSSGTSRVGSDLPQWVQPSQAAGDLQRRQRRTSRYVAASATRARATTD